MKKNKTLRAAGILFLATMLTTCMTAGTFAKYTTSDSANDSARVAKFGVTVTADGSLFGEEYASKEVGDNPISFSGNEHTGTVQVSTKGENVVAPGTKNDTGLGFTVAGTPEVDVEINTTVDIDKVKTVYLRKGSYAVMSKLNNVTEENFDADSLYIKKVENPDTNNTIISYEHPTEYAADAEYYKAVNKLSFNDYDYNPIIYQYQDKTGEHFQAYDDLKNLCDAINKDNPGITCDGTYKANTDIETCTRTLTWYWLISNPENPHSPKDPLKDAKDTILGDIAAGRIVVKTTDNGATYSPVEAATGTTAATKGDYNLTVSFNMAVTVDQID